MKIALSLHPLPNHHVPPKNGHATVNLNPKVREAFSAFGPNRLLTSPQAYGEQLKEDDMECIVNQDELAMNHQEQATSPSSPPARLGLDQKTSPQTPSKENLYEGDLGLGGYELKLAQTPGQSPLS
ncbi:Sodium/Hydrogen Exchanger 9 [Manis pentadactyla]|nr:Sodium/Hydrogen Exchanger 9 [Manis pentadactyla]